MRPACVWFVQASLGLVGGQFPRFTMALSQTKIKEGVFGSLLQLAAPRYTLARTERLDLHLCCFFGFVVGAPWAMGFTSNHAIRLEAIASRFLLLLGKLGILFGITLLHFCTANMIRGDGPDQGPDLSLAASGLCV